MAILSKPYTTLTNMETLTRFDALKMNTNLLLEHTFLQQISFSKYQSLKFHTPYKSRLLLCSLLAGKHGRTVYRSLIDDCANIGIDSTQIPFELFTQFKKQLSTTIGDHANDLIPPILAPLLSLLSSVYLLVKELMNKQWHWDNMIAIAVGICSAIYSISVPLNITLDWVDRVPETALALLNVVAGPPPAGTSTGDQANNDTKDFVDTTLTYTKIVSLMGMTICTLFGFDTSKPLTKITGALSATKTIENTAKEIMLNIFGLDVDGIKASRAYLKSLEDAGENYTRCSKKEFASRLDEINSWKKTAEEFLRTLRPRELHIQTLTNVYTEVNRLLVDFYKTRSEIADRPVPVALYLWGPGGRGKTSFLNHYLIPSLNASFGLPKTSNSYKYDLNSGKFFRSVTDERWAVFDEFGAHSQARDSPMDLTSLNAMISGGTSTIAGASLESKHQTCSFNGIFLCSNRNLEETDCGFNPEAMAAFKSRLVKIHIDDPSYNQNTGRENQVHRQAGYEHLAITLQCKPGTKLPLEFQDKHHIRYDSTVGGFSLTPEQTVDYTIAVILHNQKTFEKLEKVQPYVASDSPKLWSRMDAPISSVVEPNDQANSERPNVFFISGEPGIGKSRDLIPQLKSCFTLSKYQIETGLKVNQKPTIYILDDFEIHTLEGQQEYKTFYDEHLRSCDIVIFISNYGNPYSQLNPRFWTIKIDQIPLHYAGISRRLSLYTEQHLYYDRGVLKTYSGKAVNPINLAGWMLDRVCSTTLTTHFEPLPAVHYDIDITFDTDITMTNYMALFTAHPSLLRFRHLGAEIGRIVSFYAHSSTLEIGKRVMQYVRIAEPQLNIRICTLNGSIGMVKSDLYIDEMDLYKIVENANTQQLVLTTLEGKTLLTFDRNQLKAIEMDTYVLNGNTDLQLLVHMKRVGHPTWIVLKSYIQYTWMDQAKIYTKAVYSSTLKVFNFVLENIFLTVVIILFAVVVYYFFKSTPEEVCFCRNAPEMAPCPYLDPQFDVANAKGRGPKAHFKAFIVNGQCISSNDADQSVGHERLLHDIKFNALKGVSDFISDFGAMKYRNRFDFVDNRWHSDIIDDKANAETDHFVDKLYNNVYEIFVRNGNMKMRCTFLNDEIAILPRHFKLGGFTWLLRSFPGIEMRKIYEDPTRELLLISPYRNGRPCKMPNVKDLTKHLPTWDQQRAFQNAVMLSCRGDVRQLLSGPYCLQERNTVPFGDKAIQTWTTNVGLTGYGQFKGPFYNLGDCGFPLYGQLDNEYYILGVHAANRAHVQMAASTVLTVEIWNEMVLNVGTDQPNVGPDDYFHLPDTQVMFPKEMLPRIQPRAATDYTPQGGVHLMCHYLNGKPMDSKNRSCQYNEFEDTTSTFDQKVPALSEEDIYIEHRDKIPEDARGLRHPFMIRVRTLEENIYNDDIYQDFKTIAMELATFFRVKQGRTLHPISLKEAIVGCHKCTPLDKSTSAGALIAGIFNSTVKVDLFATEETLKPNLERWTNDQYTMAREGIRLSFPADANYKSEFLLKGKEWRKRIFYNVPLPTVLNLKRILAPVQHAFTSDIHISPFILAAYPIRDWDVLGTRLKGHSGHAIALDAKSFDHSLPGGVLRAVGSFLHGYYDVEASSKFGILLQTFMDEVAFMPLMFKNVIVSKEGGMPSGCFGTSLLDAICGLMIFAYAWKRITNRSILDFMAAVKPILCGDDVTMTVLHEFLTNYNAITISQLIKNELKMTYVMANDKGGEMTPWQNFEEVGFCSRKFIRHADHPSFYIPKLKTASLYSTLTFSACSDPMLRYEQYLAIRLEMYAHGRAIYSTYEDELSSFARKYRIDFHVPSTYDQTGEVIWQELNSPYQINERTCIDINRTRVKPLQFSLNNTMSQSKLKQLRREFKNALLVARSFEDFEDKAQSQVELVKTIVPRLLDYNVSTLQCPGTSDQFPLLRMNSLTTYAAMFGHCDPEQLATVLLPWLSSVDSNVLIKNGAKFNNIRRAHFALIDHLLTNHMTPAFHELKEAWVDAFRICPSFQWKYFKWFAETDAVLTDGDTANSGPQQSLPELGAGEGGTAVIGGSTGVGQMDPLAAPQMTITPAVATSSQEIADSDSASIPVVLDTIGGLSPEALPLVNYSDNIVSLCNKPIYVKRYNVTSNTVAGTILEEIDFNPWDPSLVSKPILQYGALHTIFNGAMDFILNSYSAATIVGSVILSYVPPLLQENFVPTIENLKTVPSAILNLKAGGSCKITVTGGNLTDAAVSRINILNGSSVYGKIYIAAYTDIVNAYGANVSIPIVRLCSLGSVAYFSHPAYLVGLDSGGSIPTQIPAPPPVENLLIDGAVVFPYALSNLRLTEYSSDDFIPLDSRVIKYLEPKRSDNNWKFLPLSDNGNMPDGADINLKYWSGHNPHGSTPTEITFSAPRANWPDASAVDVVHTKTKWDQSSGYYHAVQEGVLPYCRGAIPPLATETISYGGFGLNQLTDGAVMSYKSSPGFPGLNSHSVNCKVQGTKTPGHVDTLNWYKSSIIDVGNHGHIINEALLPTKLIRLGAYGTDSSHKEISTYLVTTEVTLKYIVGENQAPQDYSYRDLGEGPVIEEESGIAAPTLSTWSFTGTPTATTTSLVEVSCPAGYATVILEDNDNYFIPVVSFTDASRSTPYSQTHCQYMYNSKRWLALLNLASFSYDVSDAAGNFVCAVLVNDDGIFVYNETYTIGAKLLFPNASSLIYNNYQSYPSNKWPAIASLDTGRFISRMTSTASLFMGRDMEGHYEYYNTHTTSAKDHRDHIFSTKIEKLERMMKSIARDDTANAAMMTLGAIGGAASGVGGAIHNNKEYKLQQQALQQQMDIANMANTTSNTKINKEFQSSLYGSHMQGKIAQTNLEGSMYSADKAYAAVKYQSDQNMALQQMKMGVDATNKTAGVNRSSTAGTYQTPNSSPFGTPRSSINSWQSVDSFATAGSSNNSFGTAGSSNNSFGTAGSSNNSFNTAGSSNNSFGTARSSDFSYGSVDSLATAGSSNNSFGSAKSSDSYGSVDSFATAGSSNNSFGTASSKTHSVPSARNQAVNTQGHAVNKGVSRGGRVAASGEEASMMGTASRAAMLL